MKEAKSVKSTKAAVLISVVTLSVVLAGVLIDFVQTKQWSAEGCSVLALNTIVCCTCLNAYKACSDDANQ
jgi:hypothetical protein